MENKPCQPQHRRDIDWLADRTHRNRGDAVIDGSYPLLCGWMKAAHVLNWHSNYTLSKASGRMALLLILGSSPMVKGIPAFFAASRFGIGVILFMAIVFGLSTIATYVLLCVYSAAGLRRVSLGPVERYGEVISGIFIALVGLVFWLWPLVSIKT